MLKRYTIAILIVWILTVSSTWAKPSSGLYISGKVQQTLHINLDDLKQFESETVRICEVSKDKQFHGVFYYQGPSLQTLLKFAKIEKTGSDFNKPIDLAIVVRNKAGQQTVLSWGELFYRNLADVIIAIQATPFAPHTKKNDIPQKYWPYLDQLQREVKFPKLVIANDFYTDRCLEEVTRIDVVDLHSEINEKKNQRLYSSQFTICGDVEIPLKIDQLPNQKRAQIMYKEVGDGQGYHGLKLFEGVSLSDLLKMSKIRPNANSVLIVSAPDGYRALFSYGEIFLSERDGNIIIADQVNNAPMDKNGRFCLVTAKDLSADRHVKAIEKIEVISIKNDADTL